LAPHVLSADWLHLPLQRAIAGRSGRHGDSGRRAAQQRPPWLPTGPGCWWATGRRRHAWRRWASCGDSAPTSGSREPRLPLLLAVLPPVLLKADTAAPGNALLPLLKQERLRDFIQKRERGELLIQKINRLQDNLLKKVIFEGFVSPP